MRGQRATGITLGGVVAVGAALVAAGAITGGDTSYRAGVGLLLLGLACLVMHRSHCNTNRLIEHQARLAAMANQQRQEWAQYGYRAGEIDTLGRAQTSAGGPNVVHLPLPGESKHRNGA